MPAHLRRSIFLQIAQSALMLLARCWQGGAPRGSSASCEASSTRRLRKGRGCARHASGGDRQQASSRARHFLSRCRRSVHWQLPDSLGVLCGARAPTSEGGTSICVLPTSIMARKLFFGPRTVLPEHVQTRLNSLFATTGAPQRQLSKNVFFFSDVPSLICARALGQIGRRLRGESIRNLARQILQRAPGSLPPKILDARAYPHRSNRSQTGRAESAQRLPNDHVIFLFSSFGPRLAIRFRVAEGSSTQHLLSIFGPQKPRRTKSLMGSVDSRASDNLTRLGSQEYSALSQGKDRQPRDHTVMTRWWSA